jgi:hypothetical protein
MNDAGPCAFIWSWFQLIKVCKMKPIVDVLNLKEDYLQKLNV